MGIGQFSTTNTFVPLGASTSTSGQSNPSSLALDPTQTSRSNFSTLLRNRAYARLDVATIARANPDFDTGAAGRILSSLTESNAGNDPRITRGYIRRTVIDNADPTSPYRLYFMYNPEMINRSYVSYLDQQALDPFNTIFGSNNLVAPPGILDFSFDLFFDRQAENAGGSMPRGVLEDFDYFDLVIRGVVPDAQQPDLPDNGIMMINPRNVTVVFSPQLSIQGRPNSASVAYQKFDHNMRPIRMTINLGLKVLYIGPVRQDFTFAQSKEQGTVQATVPYENTTPVQINAEQLRFAKVSGAPSISDTPSTSFKNTFNQPSTHDPNSNTVIDGYPITQYFGDNGHPGIDIGCPTGTTSVSPVQGTVVAAGGNDGLLSGYGEGVALSTSSLEGELVLIFGHLQSPSVSVGDVVGVGTPLGPTNNTGLSHGPHLHFEIRVGGQSGAPTDPLPFLVGGWHVLR